MFIYTISQVDYDAINAVSRVNPKAQMVICGCSLGAYVSLDDLNSPAFAAHRAALDAISPLASRPVFDLDPKSGVVQSPDAVIYSAKQSDGYLDSTTGIKLKTTDAAQTSFTKFVTLTMLAMQAGAITAATVQSIWDYDNVEHALPTGQLLALMLRYGLYCSTMFTQYAP